MEMDCFAQGGIEVGIRRDRSFALAPIPDSDAATDPDSAARSEAWPSRDRLSDREESAGCLGSNSQDHPALAGFFPAGRWRWMQNMDRWADSYRGGFGAERRIGPSLYGRRPRHHLPPQTLTSNVPFIVP